MYCKTYPTLRPKASNMGKYDTISKRLIQTYPQDFLCFTLERDDVEFLANLDTEQPNIDTHRTDSLISARIGTEKVVLHYEFQTTDSTNPPMPRRMAGYIGRAIEHYDLPIHSTVIYLRPDAGLNDPGHYIQARFGCQIVIQYKVIRLTEVEGQRVLEAGHSGLIPFASLMKPPERMGSEAWMRTCVDRATDLPLDESAKGDFLTALSVLGGLVHDREMIADLISKEGLMDLIRESSFAQYLLEQEIEENKEQWIKQGIEQGERERAIEDILDVLAIRFGLSETHPLSARIAAIDDLQRLKQLHRSAIQVSNIEVFQNMLEV